MPRGKGNTAESEARMRKYLRTFVKGVVTNPKGRPRLTMNSFIKEMEEKGYQIPTSDDITKSWPTPQLLLVMERQNLPRVRALSIIHLCLAPTNLPLSIINEQMFNNEKHNIKRKSTTMICYPDYDATLSLMMDFHCKLKDKT